MTELTTEQEASLSTVEWRDDIYQIARFPFVGETVGVNIFCEKCDRDELNNHLGMIAQIVNGWCSSHQEILEAILTAARLARVEVKGSSFCIAALRPFSISVFIDEVDLIAFSVKCKIDNSSGLLLESSTYVDVSGCLPWSKIEAEFRIS